MVYNNNAMGINSDFGKAHWSTEGNHVNLSMPISKVDKEKRIVSGFATLDNLDRQDDIVPAEVSLKAFNNFRGNIREMHQPIAVGKVVSFREEKYYDPKDKKFYNGIYVSAYVSKGAQDTWEKVLDGTLTGFSIGGNINDFEDSYDEGLSKKIRIIKDYDLNELSLVDSPANQFANIFSVEKGYMSKALLENVYWCNTDDLIQLSSSSSSVCPRCDKSMSNIGFVESNDADKSSVIKSIVSEARRNIAKSFNVNDFVVLDQNVYGRILDISKSGSYRMNSSNTILVATDDDPVATVQLFEKNDNIIVPTDRRIIKFVSSLENVNVIRKNKAKEVSKMTNNDVVVVDEIISKAQGFENTDLPSENEPTNPDAQESFTAERSDSTTVSSTEKAIEVEIEEEEEDENVSDEEKMPEDKGMDMPMMYGDGMAKPAVQPIMNADGNPTIPTHEMNGKDWTDSMMPAKADGSGGGHGYNEELEPTSAERAAMKAVESMAAVVGTLADTLKSLNEKVEGLQKQITGVTAQVSEAKEEFGKRVDAVEKDTAFRKSGDLGEIVQEYEVRTQKSLWDGRFLSTSNIFK